MIESAEIAARNDARNQAIAIGELIHESLRTIPEDAVAAFWEELRGFIPATELPRPAGVTPLSESEFRAFAEMPIEFGPHKGAKVAEVPIANLEWLAELDFQKWLKRYLLTVRIRQR